MYKFIKNDKWLYAAASYGAVRKAVQVNNAQVEIYDKKKNEHVVQPMLTTMKVVLTAWGAGMTVYGWPYFLVKDIYIISPYISNEHKC